MSAVAANIPTDILVKPSQAISMITKYILAGLVPFITSSPGMGKSSIVRQIATEYDLLVIDLRLSQVDPTELMGFPKIGDKKATYIPMSTFPIRGDELPIKYDDEGNVIMEADGKGGQRPKRYKGWLLFLDEFNSCAKAVEAAAYKLILDKMVGQFHLHQKVAIVLAGNKATDNAIVNELSTATQSRVTHMELTLDYKEWIDDWAIPFGIDHRITSYIKFKPTQLHTFSPEHSDVTFACPRTWEYAHKVLKQLNNIDDRDALPMLAGTISSGVAREFLGFCRIYKDLPTMEQIERDPTGIDVPMEPSVLFAITGAIAQHVKPDNFDRIVPFIQRLGAEFQVICLKELVRRNRDMMKHPTMVKWIASSKFKLFN